MSDELFGPADFAVPDGLTAEQFRLEPLGPQHNEADYAAWTASIDHIRATPGFADDSWPHEMALADNLRDLAAHARGLGARRSGAGSGPTAPRSTRSCTTRSWPGWSATGRLTRSSTPRGPEAGRGA